MDPAPARPSRPPSYRPPSQPPSRPDRREVRLDLGPGRPWPLVSLVVLVGAVLLAWFALDLGGLGGLIFPVGLAAGCVLAVCAVRRDQLFVPAVQPPMVATVAVIGAAVLTGRTGSSTTLALAVVAPLAGLFWWLLAISGVCVAVAVVRSGRLAGVLAGSGR